jgi:hypothetical protein
MDRLERFTGSISPTLDVTPNVNFAAAFDDANRERQKAMEVLVRQNVFLTVSDAWRDLTSGMVSLKGRELTVHFSDPAKRDDFINWLESRKTKFKDAPPSMDAMEQLELFGEQ